MTSLRIIVASKNPVKIEAARQGFAKAFPDAELDLSGVSVPSGVSDQPMTDDETLLGARNRAQNARSVRRGADYWVGIEGGIHTIDGSLMAFAWVVVLSEEKSGRGRTGTFTLPEEVATLVREGMELGHADDVVFGRDNSKQQNGSVGLLTNDIIDRTSFYVEAVVLALVPFLHPGLSF